MGFFADLFKPRAKVGDIVHVYEKEELEETKTSDEVVPEKVEKLIEEVESETSEVKEDVVEMTIPPKKEEPKVVAHGDEVTQKTNDIATFKTSSAVNITYNEAPKAKKKQRPLGSPEVDVSNHSKNQLRLMKIKKLISNIEEEKKNNILNLIN